MAGGRAGWGRRGSAAGTPPQRSPRRTAAPRAASDIIPGWLPPAWNPCQIADESQAELVARLLDLRPEDALPRVRAALASGGGGGSGSGTA